VSTADRRGEGFAYFWWRCRLRAEADKLGSRANYAWHCPECIRLTWEAHRAC
jgi:hypothetical protein